MAKVSLTLPSINQKLCEITVNKILEITRDVDYEIVVVSPFEIHAPKVKWVLETEPMGNLAAHNQAYLHSQGDLIVIFTDDIEPLGPHWLKNAHDFYLNRSKHFFPYACGLDVGVFHVVYGRLFPTFPMISRQSIAEVGAYLDPAYHSYYGDPDLALRVWAAGGRCESCLKARVRGIKDRLGAARPRDSEPGSWQQRDLETFLNRWHHIYGSDYGWDPSDICHNLPLRFLQDFGFCEPDYAVVKGLIRRRDRDQKIMKALSSLSRRTGVHWPLQPIKRLLGITTS